MRMDEGETWASRGVAEQREESLFGRAREEMAELAEELRQEAVATAAEGKEEVTARATQRKAETAEMLTEMAAVLHDAARRFEVRGRAGLGDSVDDLARRLDNAAIYLRESDFGELADDVERFARRRPRLFLAGSFLTGVVVARFLKSSSASHRRMRAATASGGRRPAAPSRSAGGGG
jgi:hypothetical protein